MKKRNSILLISICLIVLLSFSSPILLANANSESLYQSNNDHSPLSNNGALQPYENSNIYKSWVRQATGNCGPTSLYMIFKFYGDHLKDDIFHDDDYALDDSRDIRIDENFLSATSNINVWLGYVRWFFIWRFSIIAFTGVRFSQLERNLNLLKYQGEDYYQTRSNVKDITGISQKRSEFSYIYENLLLNGYPVILHIDRDYYSGHYIVCVGKDDNGTPNDTTDDIVLYMDPNIHIYEDNDIDIVNKVPKNPILSVSYEDFIANEWYDNGDGRTGCWDGTWLGFFHEDV